MSLLWWCSSEYWASSFEVKTLDLAFEGCTWQWWRLCDISLLRTLLWRFHRRALEGENPRFDLHWLDMTTVALARHPLSKVFVIGEPFLQILHCQWRWMVLMFVCLLCVVCRDGLLYFSFFVLYFLVMCILVSCR